MDLHNKRVFLSGPMSDREDYHVADFALAHHRIKALAPIEVYDPAIEYLKETYEHSREYWIRKSVTELMRARKSTIFADSEPYGEDGNAYDVLVQLPGWESSGGARLEADVAKATKIQVVTLAEVLEQ